MIWKVDFELQAEKELDRLDHQHAKRILRFLHERIATGEDPKRFGKPLGSDKYGLWRYRVGDYRIICRIEKEAVTVLVLRVGHRKNVYED